MFTCVGTHTQQMWDLNKSAYNGKNKFWMEKASDMNNQRKIYSSKHKNNLVTQALMEMKENRFYKNSKKNELIKKNRMKRKGCWQS